MSRPLRNRPASVRARLDSLARITGRPVEFLRQLYVHERFLARLADSTHRDRFVLKGAVLLYATAAGDERMRSRPTKDIDLFGRRTPSDPPELQRIFKEVCAIDLDDGMTFDPAGVTAERINAEADYAGVRIKTWARLGQIRERVQVDVAFGHVMTPDARTVVYPTLLEAAPFSLPGYPLETVVSEKFEAMVKLGELNSRMKDFYDLCHLATTHAFGGMTLQKALIRTFNRRGTKMAADTVVLREPFRTNRDRQAQWAGYLRKVKLSDAPETFIHVMEIISTFAGEAYLAACERRNIRGTWSPTEHCWKAV